MQDAGIPVDIILYAIIAVGLVLWLRSLLGTRSGTERQRPNPFTAEAAALRAAEAETPIHDILAAKAPEVVTPLWPAPIQSGFDAITKRDPSFRSDQFIENAKDAFAIVVTAFAEGDKETLADLLSPAVYKSFEQAIDARQAAGETVTTEVHAVRGADVIAVEGGQKARITLRFKADETYSVTNAQGQVISGHPTRVTQMTDVWTFARDVSSSDPRWLVVQTRDDVVEDTGKTPMPDAG